MFVMSLLDGDPRQEQRIQSGDGQALCTVQAVFDSQDQWRTFAIYSSPLTIEQIVSICDDQDTSEERMTPRYLKVCSGSRGIPHN